LALAALLLAACGTATPIEADPVLATITVGARAGTPATAGVRLSGVSLQRIDPVTNRVVRAVDQGGITMAAGFGSLWVTDVLGRILRIDPQRLPSG